MSEPTMGTDAEARRGLCDYCGESLDTFGNAHFASLEANGYVEFLDVGFCSWDHLAAWVAKGRPKFDEATVGRGGFDWLAALLATAFFGTVLGLMGIGIATLARWVF